MARFTVDQGKVRNLELGGFNEIAFGRDGPMLYNKHDIYVGGSLKRYGEYNGAEADLLYQLIDHDSVVVEAGANIGSHTVGLAKRCKTIHAFEPQRLMFQTLCASVAMNSLTNAFTYQTALGRGLGDSKISVPYLAPGVTNNFGACTLTDPEMTRDYFEVVPLRSLDYYELAPRLIKIDVEGMESEVIIGAENTISKHRPFLYVENDREAKAGFLINLIKSLDYRMYWHLPPLFRSNNFFGEAENVFHHTVSVNMLCVPRGLEFSTALREVKGPYDLGHRSSFAAGA